MKKILFATTALVATAGVAAAEVSISGFAEMGLYDDGVNELQFHTDIDATLSMSGETDGGLSFGAAIDIDELQDGSGTPANAATANDADDGGIAIFVSGGFGKVTLGDTDGAFDWALDEAIIGGALKDDHEHEGYSGNSGLDGANDGQILRYEYSFDAFSVAVSAAQDATTTSGVVTGTASANGETLGLGVKYSMDLGGTEVALGLGLQSNDANDIFGISAKATLANGLTAILNYSDLDNLAAQDHIGLALGYTMDALTVGFNYGEYGNGNKGYGLAVNYDLGGGAVAQFGYGSSDVANVDTYSLGLALSF